MLVKLVLAAVFKTVGPYKKHAAGGFDSHALPPFSLHSRHFLCNHAKSADNHATCDKISKWPDPSEDRLID